MAIVKIILEDVPVPGDPKTKVVKVDIEYDRPLAEIQKQNRPEASHLLAVSIMQFVEGAADKMGGTAIRVPKDKT